MNKYFFIFFTFILSQGLNTNTNYYDRGEEEVDVLLKQEISPNLFIWPVRDNLKNDYYDLFNSENIPYKKIFNKELSFEVDDLEDYKQLVKNQPRWLRKISNTSSPDRI